MRTPCPAFEMRMSGPCPWACEISAKRAVMASAEDMSTWWVEIGREDASPLLGGCRSAIRVSTAVLFFE